MNIKIGTTLELIPFTCLYYVRDRRKRPCTVVSINKEHRYFTVKFTFPGGSFLESYKFSLPQDQAKEEPQKSVMDRVYHDYYGNSCKKVVCLDNGHVYRSVSEAARRVGGYASGVSACCRGKISSYLNRRWRFVGAEEQ